MLTRAMHYLRIYGRFQMLHWRASLEYEADFWIGIVGMGLTHTTGFIFVWAFFQNVPTVVGWGLWDTAFLYALAIIPRGLVELLCDGSWMLRMLVNEGELDRLLVRPVSPVLQLVTYMNSIHGLGSVLLGGIIFVRSAYELHVAWNIGNSLFLVLTLLNAVILINAINLIVNSIAFWEPAATGSFPNVVYQFLEFGKFPLNVYDRLVQLFLTWVLPFAFVSYYPSLVLLGKLGGNIWVAYATPFTGLLATCVAGLVWRVGLARYQGTGS